MTASCPKQTDFLKISYRVDYVIVLWIEAGKLSVFQQNRRLYRESSKPCLLAVKRLVQTLHLFPFYLIAKQTGLTVNRIRRQVRYADSYAANRPFPSVMLTK